MSFIPVWILPTLFALMLASNDLVFSLVPIATISTIATHLHSSNEVNAYSNATSRVKSGDASTSASTSETKVEITSRVGGIFSGNEILNIKMDNHNSLGCTVEESLHEEEDFIFISRLTVAGCAERAGLQVGDVVIGVTGPFGELVDVLDSSVEKVKKLVLAVPEEKPLTFQIVRGTNVLERHESAVVNLCNLSRENEKEVEDCVVNFLSGGYDDCDIVVNDEISCESDEDSLIDDMMNLWADELPISSKNLDVDNVVENKNVDKPKPWSSRSSGSGTWVRDPKTGKMRNIDK